MIKNKTLRIIGLLLFSLLQYACTHPIEVTGKGAVSDSRSNFECNHLETPCEVTIGGPYEADYRAVPHRGWQFNGWQNCLTSSSTNRCEYNINAETVRQNWFKTMPALVANFTEGDADEDGVLDRLDIRPNDADCTGEGSHSYDSCAFNGLRERLSSVEILTTASGLQFITLQRDNEVLRYQTDTQQFLSPVRPDYRFEGSVTDIQHSSSLGGMIYFGGNRTVYFVADSSTDATPTELLSIEDSSFQVSFMGVSDDLIIVYGQDRLNYNYVAQERIYTAEGELLSTIDTNGIAYRKYLSDSATGIVYSIGYSGTNNTYSLRKMLISPTGEYNSVTSVDLNTNQAISWMNLSPDGSRVLLSDGSVFNTADLSLAFTISKTLGPATWLNNGELLSVQANNEWPASYSLLRSGVDGQPLERVSIGRDIANAFIATDTGAVVFMGQANIEAISEFEPNDDRDGDGVANTEDAFPDNIAASLDTDRDGYPDQWNDGFGAGDSTSDLSLDAFPVDTMCYLTEHGNNGSCDHGARIGIYYPASVIQDDNGVVYLLGANVVHRWDTETEQYLSSISVDSSKPIELAVQARNIAFHAASGDLFIAYDDGQIRRVSPSSPNTVLKHSQIDGSIRGFTASANMLFAAAAYADDIVSLDIATGLEQDRSQWPGNNTPQVLRWNQATQTLYGSGSDIQSIGVDAMGQFVATSDLAANFSNRQNSTFSISSNGQLLISYDGRAQRTSDGATIRDFENSAMIANWLNNSLITIENLESGSELTQWSSDLQAAHFQLQLDYQPLGLLADYGSIIAVYTLDQSLQFAKLSLGDADGDGMPSWWEEQNGFDDNDSFDADLDSDLDNLSNLQEYLFETDPTLIDSDADGLSDGDEVNVHQTNPSLADTDGDGLSDGDEVNIHSSSPTLADSDNDRMNDGWEIQNGLNPLNSDDGALDDDDDGYSNFEEFTLGTDAQTAGHPQVEPWARQNANARNNAYFPIALDVGNFQEAWSQRYDTYALETNGVISADRKLFRVASSNDWRNPGHTVELIDSDSGAIDKRYSIQAATFDVQQYVYDSSQLLLSGYIRHEDYTYSKTINALNVSSGVEQTVREELDDSPNNVSALFANNTVVNEVFYHGDTRTAAISRETGEALWNLESLSNTIGSAADENTLYVYQRNQLQGNHVLSKLDRITGEQYAEHVFQPQPYYHNNVSGLTLSKSGSLVFYENSTLRAFDTASLQPRWTRDIGRSDFISIGQGKVFLVVHGILFVLDEFTGNTLWVWSPPNGNTLQNNLIAFRSHVIVSGGEKTWAISIDSGEAVWEHEATGYLSYSEGKLFISRGSDFVAIDMSDDLDSDSLPNWWERKHELDDANPADATTDADDDGLNNLEEYIAGINPRSSDTDDDGISDFDEVQTYNTRPEYADSDEDGLSDNDELTLHLTSPTEKDSDGDSFSDFAEIQEYNSDPNDAASVPAGAIVNMLESFETESLPSGWTSSDPAWGLVEFDATEGNQSLLSGTGSGRIESSIFFEGLFSMGTLTFDFKGLESDRRGTLSIYVDGNYVANVQPGRQWSETSFDIAEAGNHQIEWRYTNTVYSPTELSIHYAQIDNVRFTAQ